MAATDTAVETAEKAAARGLALIMREVEGGKAFPDERDLHARHGKAMLDVQQAIAQKLVAPIGCFVPHTKGKGGKRTIRIRPTLTGYRATDTDAARYVLGTADALIPVLQDVGVGADVGGGVTKGAAAAELAARCTLPQHHIGPALTVLSDLTAAFSGSGVDHETGFVCWLTVASGIHTLTTTAASAPPKSPAKAAYTTAPAPLVVDAMPMMVDGGAEAVAATLVHPRAQYIAAGFMPLREVYEAACERELVPKSFQGAPIEHSGETQSFKAFSRAVGQVEKDEARRDPIHRLVAALKAQGKNRRPPCGMTLLCFDIMAGRALAPGTGETLYQEAAGLVEAAKA